MKLQLIAAVLGVVFGTMTSQIIWAFPMMQAHVQNNALQSEKLNATTADGVKVYADSENARLLFSDGKIIQLEDDQKFRFVIFNYAVVYDKSDGWQLIDLDTRTTNSIVNQYPDIIDQGTSSTIGETIEVKSIEMNTMR